MITLIKRQITQIKCSSDKICVIFLKSVESEVSDTIFGSFSETS
jgi:hypothetical protein